MNVDVCRLCSKCDGTLLDVFNNDLDKELCNKIGVCFGILITRDDHITKKVCKQCYFLTNSYSELRASAINNDSKLKREYDDRLKSQKLKQETNSNQDAQTSSRTSPPKVTPPKNSKSSNEKENHRTKPKDRIIKPKISSPNESKILLKIKDNNKIINTVPKKESLNEPETTEEQKPSFLNTSNSSVETQPKKTFHPSILKIRRIFPGLKIPRNYWLHDFDPEINITRMPETEVNKYRKSNLWAVNVSNNKKPGLYLKRINKNQEKESDYESDASEMSKRSELNTNSGLRSDSSFCASPTPDRDFSFRKKRSRPWGELSPSDLNNILDNRNRSCKLTGVNYNEELDEDDFDEEDVLVKRPRCSSKDSDKAENEIQVQNENYLVHNESFMNNSDSLLLFDTNKVCKTFICQTCSKLFDSHKALKEHQKQHSKNTLRCFKCSKSFPIVEDLIQHNLTVHSKDSSSEESNSSGSLTVTKKNPIACYIAKKSTSNIPKEVTNPPPTTSEIKSDSTPENTTVPETKTVNEVVDLSSDDDCEFISVEKRNLNSPTITIKNPSNPKISPILEKFLTSQEQNGPAVVNSKKQLETAIKSITPNTEVNNTSERSTEEMMKSFEDISKENKLTSVNICDEEYYLKYVFEKNIKGQKQPDSYSSFICKRPEDIKLWYLRDMDKLLEKSFVPVEFIPGNCNGVQLKYTYSGNKRVKPKSTTYKWSALNAVDIPKNDAEIRKASAEPHPPPTVLTPNGEIYTIPNMEIVGVTQGVNETTNSLVLQTSSNAKLTNSYKPSLAQASHLRSIAPKSAPKIGQTTNIKEFNKNNPAIITTGNTNTKNISVNSAIREQFIAKVLPDGSLTLVPTGNNTLQVVNKPPTKNTIQTAQSAINKKLKITSNQPSTSAVSTLKDLNLFNNQQNPAVNNEPRTNLHFIPLTVPGLSPLSDLTKKTTINSTTPNKSPPPPYAFIPEVPITNDSNTNPIPGPSTTDIPTSSNNTDTDTNKDTPSSSTSTAPVTKPLLRIKNLSELTEKPTSDNKSERYNLQSMYVQTLTNYVNSCSSIALAPAVVDNNTDNEYLQIS